MNKEIFLLFAVNIISGIGYSLVAPLFPSIALKRGLSEFTIGFIISLYAIANLLVTPFTYKFFKAFGKKNVFLTSIALEAICAFTYSLLDYIDNLALFIGIAVFFRMIHGVASSLSSVLSKLNIFDLAYSLAVSFVEEDEVVKALGILEFGWIVGLAIGPLIGSALYYIRGYSLPFWFFGFTIIVCLPYINKLHIHEDGISEDENGFFAYLFDFNVILVFLCVMVDCITKTFYFPTLTNYLQTKFGLGLEIASTFFVIDMIMYVVTLNVLNSIIKSIGLKLTMLIGIALNIFTVLFLPPIDYLYQSPYTVMLGLFISGISNAAVNVPSICDIIKSLKENHDDIDDDKCNDIASTVWNLAVYSGESIGPILGGYLTNASEFSTSCMWVSSLNLIFAIFYFFSTRKEIFQDIFGERADKHDSLDYFDIRKQMFKENININSYYNAKVHSFSRKYTSI